MERANEVFRTSYARFLLIGLSVLLIFYNVAMSFVRHKEYDDLTSRITHVEGGFELWIFVIHDVLACMFLVIILANLSLVRMKNTIWASSIVIVLYLVWFLEKYYYMASPGFDYGTSNYDKWFEMTGVFRLGTPIDHWAFLLSMLVLALNFFSLRTQMSPDDEFADVSRTETIRQDK